MIHSLEIVTTTRELFLDDAPEAFEVHAKNDQGKLNLKIVFKFTKYSLLILLCLKRILLRASKDSLSNGSSKPKDQKLAQF